MHRISGRAIDDLDHLRQSIAVILTTPIGSRAMRRDFGSLLPELIDQPDNGATRVRLFSAIAGALMRWESRVRISRVQIQSGAQPGQAVVLLDGIYIRPEGPQQLLALRVPLQSQAAA
ncbi:GPW/gp25 family protein [Azohydromonas lata]|uniref:GPW/gp25 family protein n=1 Tax=Azohydromonas lata TaxID=45677 RepID=A0ABU5IDE3_9BURK|nr:GPW/gp25 family protein [Azohydromonas lata]MDZ5456998.1 GPW/gp25 family protein [Azohydromonas lata]